MVAKAVTIMKKFQSTLPVGGATGIYTAIVKDITISIHAPRGGSDTIDYGAMNVGTDFNPRSPWGERRRFAKIVRPSTCISIHAPRGGSDHA